MMTEKRKFIREVADIVGGVNALARLIGVTPSAVSQWPDFPPSHVLLIESASGVSRHELRPDIFGKNPRKKPVSKRKKTK